MLVIRILSIILIIANMRVSESFKASCSFPSHSRLCHIHVKYHPTRFHSKFRPILFLNPDSNIVGTAIELSESYDLAIKLSMITLISSMSGVLLATKSASKNFFELPKLTNLLVTGLLAFLSYYVFMKTSSVRWQFNNESISLIDNVSKSVLIDPVPGRGGKKYNWKYTDILNYSLLPSENFPLFFYFKETSTLAENRIDGPFYFDELSGQIHIFPIISNINQLKENLDLPQHSLHKLSSSSTFHLQSDMGKFIKGLEIL